MREIKFRAWDNLSQKMFGIVAINLSVAGVRSIRIIGKAPTADKTYSSATDKLLAPRFELMQYTGLKDKNGKEIFEGDIVKAKGISQNDFIDVVSYSTTNANFIYAAIRGIEVIGNIYENKELINA